MVKVSRNIQRILLHGSGETFGKQVGVGQQSLMNCVTAVGRFIRAVVRNAVPTSTESAHLSPRILFVDVQPTDHADKQDQQREEKEQKCCRHMYAMNASSRNEVTAGRDCVSF